MLIHSSTTAFTHPAAPGPIFSSKVRGGIGVLTFKYVAVTQQFGAMSSGVVGLEDG